MADKNSLVICPVYNEQLYLRRFCQRLRRFYFADVLFVDDGSTDKSSAILKDRRDKNSYLIRHSQRLGYGAALRSGFKFALRQGYKKIVTIDTDLQHQPEHIYLFCRGLLTREVVLGSRYIRIDKYADIPQQRLLINRYISRLIQELFAVQISDPFCGFRAYRNCFLKKIRLKEQGYGLGIEILLELIRSSVSFQELPIEAIYTNPNRSFGDGLDDPQARLLYYLQVIARKKKEISHEQQVFNSQPSSR